MHINTHKIAHYIFLLLSAIIFCNLNGVAYLFMNRVAPFSYVILGCLLALVVYLGSFQVSRLNTPEKLIIAFFFTFLLLGSIASLFYKLYDRPYIQLVTSYFSSILIIYVYYKYILYCMYSEKGDVKVALNWITFFLFVSCVFILVADITGFQEFGQYQKGGSRNAGLFANPNEAGVQANLALVFSVNIWMKQKNKFVLVLLSLVLLLELYCVFLTFSVNAMITSVVLIVTFLLLYLVKNKRELSGKIRKNIYIGGIIILSLSVYFGQDLYEKYEKDLMQEPEGIEEYTTRLRTERVERFITLFSGDITERTVASRLPLFDAGLELIYMNPIYGYGLGVFQSLPGYGLGVHNTFLMIWGEAGIIPLILFLLLLISIGIKAFSLKEFNFNYIGMGILFIFIMGSLATHNVLDDRNLNAMIGILLAILRISK